MPKHAGNTSEKLSVEQLLTDITGISNEFLKHYDHSVHLKFEVKNIEAYSYENVDETVSILVRDLDRAVEDLTSKVAEFKAKAGHYA